MYWFSVLVEEETRVCFANAFTSQVNGPYWAQLLTFKWTAHMHCSVSDDFKSLSSIPLGTFVDLFTICGALVVEGPSRVLDTQVWCLKFKP